MWDFKSHTAKVCFGDLLNCGKVSKQTLILGFSLIVPKIRLEAYIIYIYIYIYIYENVVYRVMSPYE